MKKNENSYANLLCIIILFLTIITIVSIVLFNEILCIVSLIITLVLIIIVRKKFPKNKFGRLLMWIYIIIVILLPIFIITFFFMAMNELTNFSKIG